MAASIQQTTQVVDVVIACHNPQRPIGRAVRSVLKGNGDVARPIVVCHNVSLEAVRSAIPEQLRGGVIFLEFHDGIHSPTGPFMYGLEHAMAPWVMIMGSDDELQPGAVRSVLKRSAGADAVIMRCERAGSSVPTPPVRLLPHRFRNIVRDRLLYRSAPLGIMRRDFLREHQISLTAGLSTGEDLEFTLKLWAEGRIRVQRSGPGYQINEDATDRVTMRLAPAADEMRHCEVLWADGGPKDPAVREALALKYLRIHFFGFAWLRATAGAWAPGDREYIAHWVAVILEAAPRCERILSRADGQLLRALKDPGVPMDTLNHAAIARRAFGKPATLLPGDLRCVWHREAPLRFMMASAVARVLR